MRSTKHCCCGRLQGICVGLSLDHRCRDPADEYFASPGASLKVQGSHRRTDCSGATPEMALRRVDFRNSKRVPRSSCRWQAWSRLSVRRPYVITGSPFPWNAGRQQPRRLSHSHSSSSHTTEPLISAQGAIALSGGHLKPSSRVSLSLHKIHFPSAAFLFCVTALLFSRPQVNLGKAVKRSSTRQ